MKPRTILIIVIIGLLGWGLERCSHFTEDISMSDKPLPGSDMKLKQLPVTPPDYAKEVSFLLWVEGLQIMDFYMRFEVPRENLETSVQKIIDDYNSRNQEQSKREPLPFARQSISSEPGDYGPKELQPKMKWWQPGNIKQGYSRCEIRGYAPRIWVDEDTSTVFIHVTD